MLVLEDPAGDPWRPADPTGGLSIHGLSIHGLSIAVCLGALVAAPQPILAETPPAIEAATVDVASTVPPALPSASKAQSPLGLEITDWLPLDLEGERGTLLRELVGEVFERNPEIARARASWAAAASRVPQMRALPDPVVGSTLFVLPPETRVGPQRLSLSWQQSIPWLSKLELGERAAALAALAAAEEVEARQLEVFAEARRLLDELWFLDRQEALLAEEREHLVRHEEAARARYTAGKGLQQGVLKIQAEITRVEQRRLANEAQRRRLESAFNALRDEPSSTPVPRPGVGQPESLGLDLEALNRLANLRRPEVRQASLEIERHRLLEELALAGLKPDFGLGVSYTLVEGRSDPAGRAAPPPDDGEDVLALSASVRWPRRRPRLAAQEEAAHRRRAAEESRRALEARIEGHLGDLASRLPLLYDQWRLLDAVLLAQAEEALRSAEAAYATGEIGALDLLDAEHVLFQVRTAAARARADHASALSQLEAAIAGPLPASEESAP